MPIRCTIFSLLFLLASATGWAAELRFMFWYPGEAGTTAQAQPILDRFASELSRQTPGTTWKAAYFPTETDGLAFIKRQHPAFGIISHSMYWKHRQSLLMVPIAATRPLPDGATHETLALVGGPCTARPPNVRTLFAAQPLPADLLTSVFAEPAVLPNPSTATVTHDTLKTLQSIAAADCQGAILSAAEQRSLKALKSPWAASLRQIAISRPVPTPPVVRFGNQPLTEQLRNALLALSNDSGGRDLLTEMRLAGFASAPSP